MLVTVKGIWGVTHFQEENSGFVPVLLSLLLNWNRAPPHLHSHSLRGETQANDWQSMTCKFIQATMKLATKTCNLFCASYHSRIKSILPCNKSSFCRLHKAVELLTNFCNNFSQPATIYLICCKTGLTHGWYKSLLLALSHPAIWGSNICKALE